MDAVAGPAPAVAGPAPSVAGPAPQFVFAYGSLVGSLPRAPARRPHPDGFIAELAGVRRTWGVAMNNRHDVPGYKYYTDADGHRPDVLVAFLDIWPSPDDGATVTGVCLPVGDAELQALDRRERNYDRVEITDRIPAAGGRVWLYAGSSAGRERLRAGRAAGAAVIDANYLSGVQAAFVSLGAPEHLAASLDPGDLPVVALRRHDLS